MTYPPDPSNHGYPPPPQQGYPNPSDQTSAYPVQGYGSPPSAGFGTAAAPGYGPFPPPGVPAPRRSNGKIAAAIIGAIVVLGGLGVAAWYLFGPRLVLDTERVETLIVQTAEEQFGVTPTDVECPSDVPLVQDRTDTCTATLEGNRSTYTVRQLDNQGNIYVRPVDVVLVAPIEQDLAGRVGEQARVEAVAECADGDQTVTGPAGTSFSCIVHDAANPSDSAEYTVTITDPAIGAVEYSIG
jgi:hypothetical protein